MMRLTMRRAQLGTRPGTPRPEPVEGRGGTLRPAYWKSKLSPVLEVEAQVENKDIGFVAEGQRVAVKVDTYLFTRFGLLEGTVRHVSADAATGETRPDGTRAEAARPGPPTYPVRVTLARTALRAEGRDLPLGPGMSVTAEITIDRRRILAFFLDPIAKRADEALKER
jgi:hemolysin D